MKNALSEIIRLIEHWADNPNVRHEETLRRILDLALKALRK